jgi:mannose-6-phosphate isomerase-like protein (cupin superfamily)
MATYVDVQKMSEAERDAFHKAAEARIQTFKYQKPGPNPKREKKDWQNLCKTDLVSAHIQIVKEGGENNLHYHRGADTIYFVLKGSARFYGVGDVLLGEFGPNEGILIPGGSRYWFEKTGSEDLEIMLTSGLKGKSERINLEEHKDWMKEDFMHVYEKHE